MGRMTMLSARAFAALADLARARARSVNEVSCEPPMEPIDFVYLWVDGRDPVHREKRRCWAEQMGVPLVEALDPGRYEDNEELRYSLRSVELFAPWVRKIFLVTDNQTPSWLDMSNPKISLVNHEAIFPHEDHLPSFSSCAIETHIDRIPGLSERFVYFNDDYFLGRPVRPSDFFDAVGRPRVSLDWVCLDGTASASGPTYLASLKTANALLEGRFGPQDRRMVSHNARASTKTLYRECKEQFPEDVMRTSMNRFRAQDSVHFNWFLIPHYGLATNQCVEASLTQSFMELHERIWGPRLRHRLIYRLRCELLPIAAPHLFCINSMGSSAGGAYRRLMTKLFPAKSSFEKSAARRTERRKVGVGQRGLASGLHRNFG